MKRREFKYYVWLWLSAAPLLLFIPLYAAKAALDCVIDFADELMRMRWNIARRIRKDSKND